MGDDHWRAELQALEDQEAEKEQRHLQAIARRSRSGLVGQGAAIAARRALLPLPPEAAALVDETKCRVRKCTGVLLPATRQDRSADEEGTAILVCCVCGATELDKSKR